MSERTLKQALANASRLRIEIPCLIQPSNTGFDMVILADEIESLQAKVDELEKALVKVDEDYQDTSRELDKAEKDCAFYRCCALSGEIPTEGSEPSASTKEQK